MPLNIIRNDITKVAADAIVNTANPEVAVGAGVDSAIYKAAGPSELLTARAEIGKMRPGEAKATPAFRLNAKYIIHTVGPAWSGGGRGEAETVAACYRNSLRLAEKLGAESIAFPLISTGTLGFPKDLALKTAISEISSFLFECDMTVLLVVYNKKAFMLSGRLFGDVKSYIEESAVVTRDLPESVRYNSDLPEDVRYSDLPEYGRNVNLPEGGRYSGMPSGKRERMVRGLPPDLGSVPEAEKRSYAPSSFEKRVPSEAKTGKAFDEETEAVFYEEAEAVFYDETESESIDEMIKKRGETFQQYLFRLIDRKGLEDVKVYKKANIDRKLFSKIKSNVDYKPSKATALAFAIALELNLDETLDLIGRAGYTFSPANVADIIISHCIDNEEYNINDINCVLFEYGQPTLGA